MGLYVIVPIDKYNRLVASEHEPRDVKSESTKLPNVQEQWPRDYAIPQPDSKSLPPAPPFKARIKKIINGAVSKKNSTNGGLKWKKLKQTH